MMDYRELDALLAEKLFGWKWWVDTTRNLRRIAPPVGGGPDTRWNSRSAVMQPWDGVSSVPRFTDWGSGGGCGFPHYSKDHKAAFTVVAAMEARGFWLSLKTPFIPGANYHAGFTEHNFTGWNSRADFSAEADNAQFAICLAALKAIGVVVPG